MTNTEKPTECIGRIQGTPRDRDGFPLIICTRCGGSGQYGPRSVEGGKCFGCGGGGWAYTREVGDAVADFRNAKRDAVRPTIARLEPGDRVRANAGDEFRTVERVEVDEARPMGWVRVGSPYTPADPNGGPLVELPGREGTYQVNCWRATVYFTDGTTLEGSTNSIIRRAATVDPAPYLAAAGA